MKGNRESPKDKATSYLNLFNEYVIDTKITRASTIFIISMFIISTIKLNMPQNYIKQAKGSSLLLS